MKMKESIYFKRVDDSKILVIDFESDSDVIYEITGVAMKVFEAIEKGDDVATVKKNIKDEYKSVDSAVIDKDIDDFLAKLEELKVSE